jgi:hypothetical protein
MAIFTKKPTVELKNWQAGMGMVLPNGLQKPAFTNKISCIFYRISMKRKIKTSLGKNSGIWRQFLALPKAKKRSISPYIAWGT